MLNIRAYAKLDLAIHIEPQKSKDGYYPVHYIDCQIDIFDRLTFKNQVEKIEVICSDPAVPEGAENFVFKAAAILKEIAGDKKLGVKITIDKNIPVKGGFGGGSSDAAASIKVLARLWKIKLTTKELKKMARVLGKDFYYSLFGKLSEVMGRGKNYEVIALASRLPSMWLVIALPTLGKPSTEWVYKHLKTKNIGKHFDKISELKTAISESDKIGILKTLSNDFEESVCLHFPVVSKIKKDLIKTGARATIMAGAGLSVVGFFESYHKAQIAKKALEKKSKIRKVIVTVPIS